MRAGVPVVGASEVYDPRPMGCTCGGDHADTSMTALLANTPVTAWPRQSDPYNTSQGWSAAITEPLDTQFPVPAYPPGEWFEERPDWLTPSTKIAVDDQGRVAGYFFNAGQCLVHDARACPKPSPTRYAAFHQQEVVVEDGTPVRVGVIGNVNGHADPHARVDTAQAHYADPSRQLIVCRAYDDEHGGYILGAMVPHATFGDVALVRRSALSGDWREMPAQWWTAHGVTARQARACEYYDCIGPTLVTRPGLPLVERFDHAPGRAAAMLGGVGGVQLDEVIPVGTTKIDVPGGISITTSQPDAPSAPPGPHPMQAAADTAPAPAVQAADVPPAAPPAPPADDAATAPTAEAFAALQDRVDKLESVVGDLIDAMSEPMAASATLPTPPVPADA